MEHAGRERIHEALAAAMSEATRNVFSTMLGIDAEPSAAEREHAGPSPSAGVVSFIGLAGQWVGTGSLSMTAALACRLSGALLMSEYEAVNEDVLDAVAEITNMIIGNVKSILEEEMGSMGLSIPTVIFGRNFITRSVGSHEWTRVRFQCAGADGPDELTVHACLLSNREHSTPRSYVAPPMAGAALEPAG